MEASSKNDLFNLKLALQFNYVIYFQNSLITYDNINHFICIDVPFPIKEI